MAEEYLHAGNYQMAKRFFERIVQPYQKEGWWLVLASVQRLAQDLRAILERQRSLRMQGRLAIDCLLDAASLLAADTVSV